MPVTKDHQQEFLVAFATAFLSWQYVENVLFMFFNTLMQHDRPELVSAAWYAVIIS